MSEYRHIPVMLSECIEGLNVKSDGIYFDGTLGGGGHSYEILKRIKGGKLYATDLDSESIEYVKQKFSEFDNYCLIKENFKNFSKIRENYNIESFDGILLDLGISSHQLDERERGFSYMGDAELDMRMNREQSLSAKTVINEYTYEKLREILTLYGEERFSGRIAENIVEQRKKHSIDTTKELCDIIERSIPAKYKTDGHPAKRTFQAVRIEVNGELEGLKEAIVDMVKALKKGGRICIITFHSLEDRIVKHCFKDLESDCICDKRLPVCVCGKKKQIEIITKKPILPTEEEQKINPRSKSAKLRIAEKV